MIIKKVLGLGSFVALVNFINSPEAILEDGEAGGMILMDDTPVRTSQRKVVRFKGNIQVDEGGKGFGVTIELDERVTVEGMMGTNGMDLPAHFLVDLMKALGTPLE